MSSDNSTSFVHLPTLFQPSASSIPVVDPKLKQFGRLWIDVRRVEQTKAVERWISEDPRQSSLCLLYCKGVCNAGDKCNQLHVDRAYAQAIRDTLAPLQVGNCCFAHGDIASIRDDFQQLLKKHPLKLVSDANATGVMVPSSALAATSFWDQYLQDKNLPRGPLRINMGRICRLHQRDACKFGTDCNNMHVCREFCASVPMLSRLQAAAPAQRRGSASDSPLVQAHEGQEGVPHLDLGKQASLEVLSFYPTRFPTGPLPVAAFLGVGPDPVEEAGTPPARARSDTSNPSPCCIQRTLSLQFQAPSPSHVSPVKLPKQPLTPQIPPHKVLPMAPARLAPLTPPEPTPDAPAKTSFPPFAALAGALLPAAASPTMEEPGWLARAAAPQEFGRPPRHVAYEPHPPAASPHGAAPPPTPVDKYLKFLLHTTAPPKSGPPSVATWGPRDATRLDQEAMLEKLPTSLLEELDLDA